ncbi:response regulator transcription factor [Cohnella candidum]|uniref:response regulator transcription factor n=1 Tax=Cohnella candidum TaxID=2674991 RepID=UPI0013DD936B|nr:response regulator [Cohnella candidum]
MFTLYLVEDESIELDFLKEQIDWPGMGLEVIGSARNGRAAWEQIQSLKPDIVLTDVKMPIMDGLKLASLIQENLEGMQTVFLSGHDEFAYVKSAITAGAGGYLLKPVDPEELSGVMEKAKTEVEKEKRFRSSRQLLADKQIEEILRRASSADGEQAWQELLQIDPAFAYKDFGSAVIKIDNREILPEDLQQRLKEMGGISGIVRSVLKERQQDGYLVGMEDGRCFLVVPASDWAADESFWQALSESIPEGESWTVTIGHGEQALTLDRAGQLFAQADQACRESFYAGPGRVIRYGQKLEETSFHKPAFSGLKEPDMHAEKVTVSGLREFADEIGPYLDRVALLRMPREEIYSRASEWLRGLSSEMTKYEEWMRKGGGDHREWSRQIGRADSIHGIKAVLSDLLNRIVLFLEEQQQDRQAVLVRRVTEIVDAEYAEALTIEYLAEKVYLSPNYLRALFKEKKGCTIHEYLTRVRLAKAVELLGDKTLKIHDVAHRVGFENTSYFCSIFYKAQGVTPNEYRKKFL